MMKKVICLISTVVMLTGGLVQAATLNEWNFYSDPAGKTLSNAYNSAGSAAFLLSPGYNDSALFTDGFGNLVSTNMDPGTTGMWTNGAMLSANLETNITSGTQYLRYDFSYDLSDTNSLNDSGCVVGFAFYDGTSNKLAGVALQYDVGATTSAPYQVTELTNMTATAGTVAVVAKVDLNAHTLAVWYNLAGDVSGFDSNTPMSTVSNLTLTSFDSLGFQATGDIQSSNSTDQVDVALLRTADSWADAVASAPVTPAAKYANEWTFERDVNGRSLSETINSGTNSPLAQFAAGDGSTVFTTNRALLCVGDDTNTDSGSVWTNGAVLDAALTSATSGVHYLRYDVNYSLTNSLNNSGTLLGVYFTGDAGDKAAGLVLGYDTGDLTNTVPSGRTLTPVTNNLALSGTLIAVAEADLDNNTLKVWYSLDGSNPTNYANPAFTNNLGLTSITNLRFHATGDFRPAGSEDYAAVDNIRHTIGTTAGGTAWNEIIEPAVNLSLPPVLTAALSDSLSGGREIGETNTLSVVISNSGGGAASAVTSTLIHDGASGDFTITSNNTPIVLNPGNSITNTYEVVAHTKGSFVFTAQALSAETNSTTTTLGIVVGAQISYLTNSISEPGGVYPGLYEPGETLEITIFSTNDGARAVSNIVNTLTAASAGFTITPSSYSYPALGIGEMTSSVYQVVIGAGVADGTYTFYVTNSSGANAWSDSFMFDVFTRQPNSDWVKADNTNDLNQSSSWSNLIVPDSTDRAVFTTNITSALTNNLGSDLPWRGIALVSNTASWTISGSNTLTTGSAGIDMSQAQANLAIASKLALATTQTWNVVTSRTLTVSGTISGTNTAPLIKSGAGTLIITNAANSYSGATIVSNGTLSVANTNVLGTGTLTLNGSALTTAGGTLLTNSIVLTDSVSISNANTLTLSGTISGSGSLTKSGSGQLFLGGTNTYSGGTTNYGFIQIGNPGALGTGPLVMMSNSTLYETSPAFTANGPSLPNSIILAGNATFTNTNTLTADILKIGGNISGPGSLTLSGNKVYLYGSNTFTGNLTLNLVNGVFFDCGDVFGNGTILTTNRAAPIIALPTTPTMVTITNNIVMNNTLRVNPLAGRTVVLSGTMSGSGVFQRTDNNSGILEITGNNSGRTGATTWQYGTFRLGHENALGSGTVNINNNSTVTLEVLKDLTSGIGVPNNITLKGITDANGNVFPFVLNLDHDLKLAGAISGTNGLMTVLKRGSGALILNGASLYIGPTYISAGSLTVNGSVQSSEITASSGTTLSGTGSVQAVTMNSGSVLDLSDGGMNFGDNLILEQDVVTMLGVKTASSALHGAGFNTLTANGTLRLDFAGNAGVTNGAVFTVFDNWGTLTDNGLQVFSFNLPPFLKLDTSNLFIDGTVTVVSATRLNAQAIEIIVPQGGTGSGSVILSNSTAGVLSFTALDDGSWPASSYQVVTQSMTRAHFAAAQFETNTLITSWNGNSSAVMDLGFTFPLYGTQYTTFSINRYGAITLGGATDGSNPGVLPRGSNPVIAPFWGSTLIAANSIRYRHESDHLVVAWNNDGNDSTAHTQEFQAWIYNDGRIRYLYQFGITKSSVVIGMQNGDFSRTLDYIPGTTSDGSLLITPKSWVSSAPETGSLNPGQSQTVTFTADATDRALGNYFFTATVRWSDGQTRDIGVFIIVTADTPELDLLPSPMTFSGPAGYITQTNLIVTNAGSTTLNYTITDSGLQGAGYSITNTTYGWTDLASYTLSAAQLGSQSLSLGFPFIYFGNVYTSLTVNANGTLSLGSGQTISPFGASLSLDANASVGVYADSRHSQFTVSWKNMAQSGGSADQTFQAVLSRDGGIRFNYQQLGSGWTNGAIQLIDSSGMASGTLVNASTTTNIITITPIYSNKVTVIGNVTNISSVKIGETTNIVTTYTATASLQALQFTPGLRRIISASPVTGTIPGGGSTNIVITGDARSLTGGGSIDVTNSTILTFSYSGFSTNVDVTFIATNSVESSYPAAAALAVQEDMWGGDPVFTSQQNPAGYPTGSYLISWPVPNDDANRIYKVWVSTDLMSGWDPVPLAVLTNIYNYVDSLHTNEPVIYYKVTVE